MSEAPKSDRAVPPVAAAAADIQEVPHDLSDRVQGLSCPNCGGELDIETGLRVVTCGYCATPLLVTSELGVRRFVVEPQVDSGAARGKAGRWLKQGVEKDPRLRRHAEIGEAFLCFLPFFRVQAECVGFALGTEERRRTVGSGKNRRVETYEVDVERKVERDFDRTYPAVNVAEWGIQRIDLTGDPLVPFSEDVTSRQGMVFPVTVSESKIREAAIERFRRDSDPSAGLKRARFRFLETLRERLSVVYYPLWVIRYRFRGRSYQVLIDGEDGTMAYGKAPGNDLYRALMLVATEAVATFLGTTVLQLAGVDCGGMLVVGGLVGAVVLWGWKKFRYGGVVVEGTGVKRGRALADTLQTAGRLRSPQALLDTLHELSQQKGAE